MLKKIVPLVLLCGFCGLICIETSAQNRKSVSASEVNGTFKFRFKGKFKGFSNEIKILALGKGKIRIAFDLVYPYLMENGEIMVNMGFADDIAEIEADEAIFEPRNDYSSEQCRIAIKFVKAGEIKVSQEGSDAVCGFGHRVSAEGTYRKISSKKPVFDDSP